MDRLTDAAIRYAAKLAATNNEFGRVKDHEVRGLQIRLSPKGSQSWSLQCRDANNSVRTFTIGNYPAIGISEARKMARGLREDIRKGSDPIAAKRERVKLEREKRESHSLRSLIDLYGVQIGGGLKTWPKNKGRPLAFFRDIVDEPLLTLTVGDFRERVDCYEKKQMARFIVGIMVPIFKWGSERGHCSEEFAKLKSPTRANRRKRVLHVQELARILPVLLAHRGIGHHDCLSFILLTLLRREEAVNLVWDDVDWNENVIRIGDTKNGQEHVLPLSRQARELLEFRQGLDLPTDLVFCNGANGKLANWDRVQKSLYVETQTSDWHRHDARRTGATLLGEMLISPHVIESALNHVNIHSSIASIYNRARYLPEVREALQRLADKLDAIAGSNVVTFTGKAVAS